MPIKRYAEKIIDSGKIDLLRVIRSSTSTGTNQPARLSLVRRHTGTTTLSSTEFIGQVSWFGGDSGDAVADAEYGRIRVGYLDDSSGVHDGNMEFLTAINGTMTSGMNLEGTDLKIGATGTPAARLEVETAAAEGDVAIVIDQDDADEAFIDYQGTTGANTTSTISTLTNPGSIVGFTQIELNGTKRWMAVYSDPTTASTGSGYETTIGEVQTTDATVTTVITFATSTDQVYAMDVRTTGIINSTAASGAAYWRRATFKNDGGTVSQISTTKTIGTNNNREGPFISNAQTYAISGTNILIRVQGAASNTINWKCLLRVLRDTA